MERPENYLDYKFPNFLNSLKQFGFLSVIFALLISLLGLLGWYLDIPQLKFIVPNSHPMHPKTGLGLFFCSLALLLFNSKKNRQLNYFLAKAFSSITFAIGCWTIIEYAFGKILFIDQGSIYWVTNDPSKYFHPSPEAAFCLALSSYAILFRNSSSARQRTFAEAAVLISTGVALLSVAGFLTGANSLYSVILPFHAIGMALQTAIAFIFLSLGALCLTSRDGFFSVFTSQSFGGYIARKLTLIILFVPMIIEVAAGTLVKAGLVDPSFRQSVVIVSIFSLFIFFSWAAARKLDSIDDERRRLELNLRESEEKYRSLIELAPESIFIADSTGKYIEVNEAACNLLKRQREEIVGKTILDLIPQDEKERLEKSKAYQETSGKTDVSDWKLKKGDGGFVNVEVSAKVLSHDRWIAFVRSIEERKKMERHDRIIALVGKIIPESFDMRERLEMSAKLVTDELGDWCSVILINEDFHIEQLAVYHRDPKKSELARELKNLPIIDATSKRIKEVVTNKEGFLIVKKDLTLFLNEVLQSERHKLYEKLGLTSVCHIPLVARGKAFGLLSLVNAESDFTHEDFALVKLVTDQIARLADNAYLYQEAMKAKKIREDLMAIVSHDLKNPLTVIDLGVQSLKQRVKNEENVDAIKEIINKISQRMESSVKRSLTLIADLLIFAKIESNALSLEKSELEVENLLEEALDAQYPIAQHKGVQLSSKIIVPHLKLEADHSKLLQVLANLIGNAVKFTESGGSIQIEVTSKSKDEVLFKISDTGSGMKEEELQHIFDRYWQPKRTQAQGSGLGLAIVKGIVEAHGGKIWAESVYGKGSSFFFTIPSFLIRNKLLKPIPEYQQKQF